MSGSVVPLIMFLYQRMGGLFSMWESMKASEKIRTHRIFLGILLIVVSIALHLDNRLSKFALIGLNLDIFPSIALLYFPRSFISYWCLAICTFVSATSSFLVYLQCSCIFHHKDIWCSRALLARESSDFLSLLPCNHNLDIWIWFPCACCWCAILALLLFEILNRTPHNEKTFLDVWFPGVETYFC